jgi:hypothetical protein
MCPVLIIRVERSRLGREAYYILMPKKRCDDVLNAWVNFPRGRRKSVWSMRQVLRLAITLSATARWVLTACRSLCCVVQLCSERFALGCDEGGSDVSFVADLVGVIDQFCGPGAGIGVHFVPGSELGGLFSRSSRNEDNLS